MRKSTEHFAITGDGYVIKKGNSYYYYDRKVKVVDVLPCNRSLRVQVQHVGFVFPDNLYKTENGKYIGA